MNTITVNAKSYEDEDDCLAAAARDVAAKYDLETWQVSSDWASDERDGIAVQVPVSVLTVQLSEEDSERWNDEEFRKGVRRRALERSEELDGKTIEIYSHDGITLDAVSAS